MSAVLFILILLILLPEKLNAALSEAHLLTASIGWAISDSRLLWTGNAGLAWTDITPTQDPAQALSKAFFLNTSAGWAILSTSSSSNEFAATAVSITATTDSGRTWSRQQPINASANALRAWAGTSFFTFLDSKHGWLALQRRSSSNFQDGALLSTADGGNTWRELPPPRTVDRMVFLSPTIGWMGGGVLHNRLYRTANGGATWQEHWQADLLPSPAQSSGANVFVSVPTFTSKNRGLIGVSFVSPAELPDATIFATYATSDGGKTWRQQGSEVPGAVAVAFDTSGSAVVRCFVTADGKLHIGGGPANERVTPMPQGLVSPGILETSFADQDHGFLILSEDRCIDKRNCTNTARLVMTQGGGSTLTDVTPSSVGPAPKILRTTP